MFNGSLREPSDHGLSVTFFLRLGQRGDGIELCVPRQRVGLEQNVRVRSPMEDGVRVWEFDYRERRCGGGHKLDVMLNMG